MGGNKTHTKNTIELNGRRYDAFSGKLVDGFSKVSTNVKKNFENAKANVAKAEPVATAKKKVARHINHSTPHKPENAKTLMRSGVQKPVKSQIKLSKAQLQASDSLVASTAQLLDTRASRKALANARRLTLSEQVKQSPKVKRFTDTVVTYAGPKAAIINLPRQAGAQKRQEQPAKPTPTDSKSRLQEMLNTGLAKSKSHEQPAPKVRHNKKSHRLYLITGLALVVLAGIIIAAYMFMPNIELQLAAMRSGVHAELPGYVPSGYSFKGPVSYAGGIVTINYAHGQQSLVISEENSSWDSQTLRDSIVTPSNTSYQTYQNKGRTIYLYGTNKATWVNDGIWYTIAANSNISAGQLKEIANSM